MAEIPIRFIFDYVDPGSYLAYVSMDRWLSETEASVSISWMPLELRPPSTAPMDPLDPDWRALTETIAKFADEEEVPFIAPRRIPWSRKAHELALHAREKGCFDPVHRALFEAHFSEGLDIGRVDVLVALAHEQGLEPAETRTVLGVDRFRPEVEDLRARAFDQGIRGVPVLLAGERRLEGFESPERFLSFLQELRHDPDAPNPSLGI